jgi:hypothetical protein
MPRKIQQDNIKIGVTETTSKKRMLLQLTPCRTVLISGLNFSIALSPVSVTRKFFTCTVSGKKGR